MGLLRKPPSYAVAIVRRQWPAGVFPTVFWLVAVGAAYLEKRNAIPAKWGTDLPPGQALADEYAAVCL
jgi:hypothetical protein